MAEQVHAWMAFSLCSGHLVYLISLVNWCTVEPVVVYVTVQRSQYLFMLQYSAASTYLCYSTLQPADCSTCLP